MIWIFAFVSLHFGLRNWPSAGFVHGVETFFVTATIACYALRGIRRSPLLEIAGGICAAFSIVMPFELAWYFFNTGPEIAMVTCFVAPFAYVGLSVLFIHAFRKWKKDKSNTTTDAWSIHH